LSTYVQTVAKAAVALRSPVVLIGHSMGGFIIQKYLEDTSADLAILLASTPPRGIFPMVLRMATRRPRTFLHTMRTGEATDSPRRTRDYFFSPPTSELVIHEVHSRLQEESSQVIRDMMKGLRSEKVTTPMVVMGAENDWLVAPPGDLKATADAFHTTHITFPGGHDMMLDFAWEQVASAIDQTIAERLRAQLGARR
jgi:pimeloyl-ACP methyl ester carboxylesterase